MYLKTCRKYSTILSNKLRNSSSLYLNLHSNDPIAWQKWNDQTLAFAKQVDKPVFLSSGYAASHWCSHMSKESFSKQQVANILNSEFIPILIDKNENPDVDSVYMMFLQTSTGNTGWPLNVFLTPQTLDPIFAGTTWSGPDENDNRHQNTKFVEILNAIVENWRNNKIKVASSAANMTTHLTNLVESKSCSGDSCKISNVEIEKAVLDLKQAFNKDSGGFWSGPKFPCPVEMSFLLNHGDEESKKMALFTLQKMAEGGIKDQIGLGFFSQSVTDDWNAPNFEKSLNVQALLLQSYIDGYLSPVSSEKEREFMLEIVDNITSCLISDFKSETGGFHSAIFPDSVGHNGKTTYGAYYTWNFEEFQKVVSPLGLLESDMLAMYWNVQERGNMHFSLDSNNQLAGRNVLYTSSCRSVEVGKMFGVEPEYIENLVPTASKLLENHIKQYRITPLIDSRCSSAWTGMAVGALARAHCVCHVEGALDTAVTAINHLKTRFDDRTSHLSRLPEISGMLDDYAFVISGLLDLHHATSDRSYLDWAHQLQQRQLESFWDAEHGGFYSTNLELAKNLIFRPKSAFDSLEPSPNSVSISNLFRLSTILNVRDYNDKAKKIVNCYSKDICAQPRSYIATLAASRMSYDQQNAALFSLTEVV